MSAAHPHELVAELRRIDAILLDPAIEAAGVDGVMRRRDEVVWSLRSACTPAALSTMEPQAREQLAALLRDSHAAGEAAVSALEAKRDRTLAELASLSRPHATALAPEPRFTERVA